MAWVRLDDQLHAHPKIQEAWQKDPAAVGLHVLALSHVGCYLTDGYVSEAFVKTLLPTVGRRRKVAGVLVDAGLWEPAVTDAGFWIHDYLIYNESRERILSRRAADSARKRPGSRVDS